MLIELIIRNFVLVEHAVLTVAPNLTVLTGETGAGKSLLLDALGAVLGDKAQPFWVRPNCDKAEVSAEFNISSLRVAQDWLNEYELNETENSCLLRRVINADGRSKAYINGTSVTLSQLRQLTELLVEMHSQHEHHALLQPRVQLALLDTFSQHPDIKQCVRQAWGVWNKLIQTRIQLQANAQSRQERMALLSFQHEELSAYPLTEGEYETLSNEHTRLSHAQDIVNALSQTQQIISNDRSGCLIQLVQGLRLLENINNHDERLTPLIVQYKMAMTEFEDISEQLQHHERHTIVDDYQLNTLDTQLGHYHRLAKKYFVMPNELWHKLQTIRDELNNLQGQSETLETVDREIEQALASYKIQADALSSLRQQAAPKLAQLIVQQLQALGMIHSRLAWEMTQSTQPQPTGWDNAQIIFSANPGQALYPMNKVASGGELARISLAIEVCVADQTHLPVLVFDEVDVGVGGGVADSIGQKLSSIAKHKQVLCITHQPQVAAWGEQHWSIAKISDGESTLTTIEILDEMGRIHELARMLGTTDDSIETQQHAQHLLNRVKKKKKD
jgi:DNA repair protein RecN (Recombination protein N)